MDPSRDKLQQKDDEADNDKANDDKPADPKKQINMYNRLIGRRNEGESPSIAPTTSVRDKIVNFFNRESAEIRQLRAQLKSHRNRLQAEMQSINKANTKYHRRLLDQIHEFRKQEKQLYSWGLKFAVPPFRMQAWARLSRSALLEEMSSEMQGMIEDQLVTTQKGIRYVDESPQVNVKSVQESPDFCVTPEAMMERDPLLTVKSKRLMRLDIQCNLTTKKFRMFDKDFAWKDQATRKMVLMDILARYKALPSLDTLTSLEKDLSWEEFCDWYAERNYLQSEIEAEYFDFIEDQREKEGRLFYRWCTAVMALGDRPEEMAGVAFPLGEDDAVDVGAVTLEESSADPAAALGGVPGAAPASVSLKMTPASIKAFIQYFANDVVGIQYGIPRDCIETNLHLAEALFYRRIHSFTLKYTSEDMQRRDEQWRMQSQLCRFVNPTQYHVPPEYLVHHQLPRTRSATKDNGGGSSSSSAAAAHSQSMQSLNDFQAAVDAEVPTTRNSSVEPSASAPTTPAAIAAATSAGRFKEKVCHCRNCRTFGLSKRLQQLPSYSSGEYGLAYARSSRVMSFLGTSLTPREVIFNLSLAYKWLLRDAIDASGSRSTIGADLLVPLFTLMVINARIPNIHMIVNFLLKYGTYEEQGDVSYSIANLEGSILFILDMPIPQEIVTKFEATDLCKSISSAVAKSAANRAVAERHSNLGAEDSKISLSDIKAASGGGGGGAAAAVGGSSQNAKAVKAAAAAGEAPTSSADEDYMAMAQLGEWLRDQQTMEDTITILQKDGWMA